MAEEPDNLVLRMLREIRAIQDEHGETLRKLESGQRELRDSVITALGFATHVNVKSDSLERRLEGIEARLARLEEKA